MTRSPLGPAAPVRAEAEEREAAPPPPTLVDRIRAAVAADLVPPAPRATLDPGSVLGLVAGWLGLVAASILRQTGVGALDTIWAEDGVIFLRRALATSLADAIGEGYAGYLHVLPRLSAELVTTLPLARAASGLTLVSAGLAATGAILVYVAAAGHVRSPALRMLLAAMVVVQPVVGVESLNSLALAQWPLSFTAFWLALWRPSRTSALLVSSTALALIMLSAPLAAVVATPLLLVRSLVVPGWRDRLPALLFGVGLAVQIWATVTQPSPPSSGGTLAQLADSYRILVAGPGLFGFAFGQHLRAGVGGRAVSAAALLIWGLVVVVALLPQRPHRLTALAAAIASPVALVVGVYGRNSSPSVIAAYEAGQRPHATRFAIVPILLLLSVLVLALDTAPPRVPPGAWRQLAAVVAGGLLIVAGMDFLVTNDRSPGPAWSAEVVEGVLACRDGASDVVLQTAPAVSGWQVEVACAELPP